tara:strand:+ start:91279 stop:92586 length:1308 start_codon:yes stop_codon:yes gene_type:complete
MNSILIVEDDKNLLEALNDSLLSCGYRVDTATDGLMALDKIKNNNYQIVLSDVQLPSMDGLSLVQKIKTYLPDAKIIIMTAFGTIQDAVYAIQQGASDYISKPFEIESLISKFNIETQKVQVDEPIVTNLDLKMQETYRLAEKVSNSDATVLLTGESGTGKEVLSRYIHTNSNRKDMPFVAVNCAAIPDNMLEAMLFGYEKGAFTGAVKSSDGKFEQANGGTLLLDEISEMPVGLQAKLLRVLQEKEVERLGGKKIIPLDVRVIATTNRNLPNAIKEGSFREDLYFRLNVFPIMIPTLRERKKDIITLSEHLLKKHSPKSRYQLNQKAKEKLLQYDWPGNVRELENILHRALILCSNNCIEEEHIVFDMSQNKKNPNLDGKLQDRVEHTEYYMILEVLEALDGNRKETAEKLGVSPRTLRYKLAKMKELGIKIPN